MAAPEDKSLACKISLAQFAGVSAALAEDFPLQEILEQEQIDAELWPVASRLWTARIVGSAELQLELIEKRRIAEDCLGPKIDPLDSELEPWAGVMAALANGDDAKALTNQLGITMPDISRLGRCWKRKLKDDPELVQQLQALGPTAKPPASIQVGPRELRPFPWTPPKKETGVDGADGVPAEPIDTSHSAAVPRVQLASFQLQAKQWHSAPVLQASVAPKDPATPQRKDPDRPILSPPPPLAPPRPANPDSTSEVDARQVFEGVRARGIPFAPASPSAPLPKPIPMPNGADSSGDTLLCDPLPKPALSSFARSRDETLLADPLGQQATLPFQKLDPARDLMKLDRYVELAVELRMASAQDAEAIMRGFGLEDAELRARIHRLWQVRFQANADLRVKFQHLVAEKAKRRTRSGG